MSLLSQFFPSGGGTKMDVDVFILSGGGGAAISNVNFLSVCQGSGHGGGGAVYQGTIPIEPGSTVPIVVGGGGAGGGPSPCTTFTDGAIGGCSKLTFPEGTICVAGGGGGAISCKRIGDLCSTYFMNANPTLRPTILGTHTAGTGGSGGCCCVNMDAPCGLQHGPGASAEEAGEGGRSIYSAGSFVSRIFHDIAPVGCLATARMFKGKNDQNHQYGAYYGAPGSGGIVLTGSPPTKINSQASGGAGGGGESTHGMCVNGPLQYISIAGKGICTDISGCLQEYGAGRTYILSTCFPTCCDGLTNFGQGGAAGCGVSGCGNGGSGGSGTVIVKYPTQFAAAPSSPGATDCSPITPGYYTYKFNSSGSITLP